MDWKKYSITIDGATYFHDDFSQSLQTITIPHDLLQFLREWYNDSPLLSVQTSGSTGTPKIIQVEKMRMLESAKMTCDFLGLRANDSALLCMDLKYIGAKMMVVRSLLRGMNLIYQQASGNPLASDQRIDFVALTPLQVYNTLQNAEQTQRLKKIRQVIIGGGAIDDDLKTALADFPNIIWSTYGMTETLSHIALKRLNGSSASDWYTPFDGVSLSLSDCGALIVNAPKVSDAVLETNDLAEINEAGQFRILGRKDNIINSGGVKIQIEEVENKLKSEIKTDFAITSVKDAKFGEIVVLLVKGGAYSVVELESICIEILHNKYWIPKRILLVDKIPTTETSKPKRKEIRKLAINLIKQ